MGTDAPTADSATRGAKSRRAVLLAGAAGLAGLAADSLISAQPASATEDSAVLLGEDNTGATARTGVGTSTSDSVTQGTEYALLSSPSDTTVTPGGASTGVVGVGAAYGVVGSSPVGIGVSGTGSIGVRGTGNPGSAGTKGESLGGAGVVGTGGDGEQGGAGVVGVAGAGISAAGVLGIGGVFAVQGIDGGGDSLSVGVAAMLTATANPSPALWTTTVGTGVPSRPASTIPTTPLPLFPPRRMAKDRRCSPQTRRALLCTWTASPSSPAAGSSR
jgi:hypothetical protein